MNKKHTYITTIDNGANEKLLEYCSWLLLDHLRTANVFPKNVVDDMNDEVFSDFHITKEQSEESLRIFNKPLESEEKEIFTEYIIESLLLFGNNYIVLDYLTTLTAEALTKIEFVSDISVELSKATSLCTEFVEKLFKAFENDCQKQTGFRLNDRRMKDFL